MVKKHHKNKHLPIFKKERTVLWSLIAILVLAQLISGWYLVQLRNNERESSKNNLYTFINNTEKERYRYPVISIAENRVYIPEARVYLPLTKVTRDLRYDYFQTGKTTRLSLSTQSFVGVQIEKDDHACDKTVVITQSRDYSETTYSEIGEISPTKDALRYMTAHNKGTCSIYLGTVQEELIESAKLINQY